MTHPAPLEWTLAAGFAAGGIILGAGYFALLRRSLALRAAGALALALGRLLAAVAFFGFAARFGALPLLSAFLGFLAARPLALRAAREAS
jgi:hypothetical protein